MVLSKQVIAGDISVDIIVDYNFNVREVEDVISIIFIDAYDGSEIETSVLLCEHFPSVAKYLVDTINWDEVYTESVSNLKKDMI
jgi:hypothetical protein